MRAPEGIKDKALVLMADIFPTGQTFEHMKTELTVV